MLRFLEGLPGWVGAVPGPATPVHAVLQSLEGLPGWAGGDGPAAPRGALTIPFRPG